MANLVRARGWGQIKPPLGAQVDWGHPLAQDLFLVTLLGNGRPQVFNPTPPIGATTGPLDMALAYNPAGTNIQDSVSPLGEASRFDGTINSYVSTPGFTPDQWTFHASVYLDAVPTAGGANTYFGVMINAETPGSGTFNRALGIEASTLKWGVAVFDGAFHHAEGTAAAVGQRVLTASADSSTVRLFENGVETASVAAGAGTAVVTPEIVINKGDTAGAGTLSSRIPFAYAWQRHLNQGEVQWLNEEPYAFFVPPGPKVLYFGPFNPPATVTTQLPVLETAVHYSEAAEWPVNVYRTEYAP